ncbi:alcohol dehydrogenase catalytic domain-containing protein [Brevundimonas sp.]|uniref:alcohol dehydrogenase catalytic domain-containing protein n=1 Tax=Brevundimonas sp. TaxID=1871086 RepID=UPI003D108969
MHEVGAPMVVDEVPIPRLGSTDVLVEIAACGIVPNLGNILTNWPKWCPHLPLPKLPATFGLDPTGRIVEVGDQVIEFAPGDRVYVNPARSCGGCYQCQKGQRTLCEYYTFNGYFGFGPGSQKIYDIYPFGGFCEFMSAPQYALVKLPDSVSFEQAARLGYIGTAYGAMKQAGAKPAQSMLVNGCSGTLGLPAVLLGLAMGMTRIFGTGRNRELLERVRSIAPDRIEVFSTDDGGIADWVKDRTNGVGVDFVIDALGPGTPVSVMHDAMNGLRRGGKLINVGGTAGELPIDVRWLMDFQYGFIGSNWFSAADGRELVEMADRKTLDLSVFEHHHFPLDEINTALSDIENRSGGFSNYVIVPPQAGR